MNPSNPDVPNPPEPAVTPGRPFTISDLFIGPDGLRAFWGILLFYALWEALPHFIYPLVAGVFPAPAPGSGSVTPRTAFVYEGAALSCVLIATWLMAKLEQRTIAAYGL